MEKTELSDPEVIYDRKVGFLDIISEFETYKKCVDCLIVRHG